MPTRTALRRLLPVLLTFPTAAPAVAQATLATAPDPDAVWRPVTQGRLPNGLRYAILPRRGNAPGAGLLIRVEGGFIAERRPGERGLTHLIEHLALVSPTTSAPDDLHHFVRLGLPLTFPAPSAGTTSWRETNLFVSTRATRTADLDALLGLFREVASDMTLRADAVDEQRADVMREMGERKLGNVIYASYIAAVAPGSPTDVIDAQNSDDVPTASVTTIRALYHRLYRPENLMVVVVGDVDPSAMAALIRQRFGDWHPVGPAPARAAVPTFRPGRIAPISASSLREGRSIATVSIVMPTPAPPHSRTQQMQAVLTDLVAMRAVNDRLALAQPNSPPGKRGLFIENGEQGHRLFLVWDKIAPGQWRSGVADLKALTCDVNRTGFSGTAWHAAKQGVIRDLEQRAAAMASVPNVELAKDLSHALADHRDLVPPDELLRYARSWLPTFDERAGGDWWRGQWRGGVEHIRVETPELATTAAPAAAIRAALDAPALRDAGCRVRR